MPDEFLTDRDIWEKISKYDYSSGPGVSPGFPELGEYIYLIMQLQVNRLYKKLLGIVTGLYESITNLGKEEGTKCE